MKILLLIVCLAIGGIVVETTAIRLKRSVGGRSIGIEKAPYFVSITQRGYHLCGGALITTKHVLTAAKCLVNEFGNVIHDLTVESGTAKKYDGDALHMIEHLFIAPGFDVRGFRNDIAVIVLSENVKTKVNQKPIALPKMKLRRSGKARFIAFASTDNPWENTLLHTLRIKIRSMASCSGISSTDPVTYLPRMFCGLSEPSESIDTGDSGGPLVRNGKVIGILASSNASSHFFIDVYAFTYSIEEAKKCWTSSCSAIHSKYILYPSYDQ